MELIISFFYVGQENCAYTGDNEGIQLKNLGKYFVVINPIPTGQEHLLLWQSPGEQG